MMSLLLLVMMMSLMLWMEKSWDWIESFRSKSKQNENKQSKQAAIKRQHNWPRLNLAIRGNLQSRCFFFHLLFESFMRNFYGGLSGFFSYFISFKNFTPFTRLPYSEFVDWQKFRNLKSRKNNFLFVMVVTMESIHRCEWHKN